MDTLRETLRLWTTRLRMIFRRSDTDFDDELAFHIEQETAQHIARGMSPDEARRQAMIAFGSLSRTRQHSREVSPMHWLEIFLQDVRYALRGFARNRVFTLTVILTLMLGIGATTAVFSVVDRILFRALPYANAGELVSVGLSAPVEPQEFMLGGSYYEWRDHQTPFKSLTSEIGASPCDLTEDHPRRLSCAGVEANFLPTLGILPLLGRNFTPDEDMPHAPKTALISFQLWKSRFAGEKNVIDQLINIDGAPVRIIGVLPESFEMPRLQAVDVVMSEALDVAAQRRADPGRPMWGFARLKPNVTITQAAEQLQPLFDYSLRLAPAPFRKEVHLRVRSLRDRQMQDVRKTAAILLALALGVLLISCANVISLLLARGAARESEMAIRSALGASNLRLIRQMLIECLLLSICGAGVGYLFAQILLRIFIAAAPQGMLLLHKPQLDVRIVGITIATSVFCAILCGLVSTWTSRSRLTALTGRSVTKVSRARLRMWLVGVQLAASVVLMIGGVLLFRSFINLERQHLGMQTQSIATASISLGERAGDSEHVMAFYLELERDLRYGPGVRSLAISDTVPPGGYTRDQVYASIAIDDRPRPASGTGGIVTWRWVTPEYFQTLHIPILEGRSFTEDDRNSAPRLVVLSRSLARRMFPGGGGIGHYLRLAGGQTENNPRYEIVGIADDVKNGGLAEGDKPEYYRLRRNNAEDWTRASAVIVDTSLPAETIKNWIRAQIGAIEPTVPVTIETMQERIGRMADRPRFVSLLVGFFAATGLLMAVIGLYGVIAYLVTQREREIGVRMALGASRESILRMILGRSLRLIVCGAAVGLCAALGLSHLLRSMLYDVGPHDPFSYTIVLLLLAATGMMASLLPARSATQVDPATVLRSE